MSDPLIFVRAVHLFATMLATGVVFFQTFVAAPALAGISPVLLARMRDRSRRLLALGLAIALMSGAAWLALLAARIGDRSDCGPFAKLRPGTEIGDDVHIGSFTELVRTRVGRASKVPHVSYLGDADVGEGVNIGAGTITANFDGTNKNRTKIGDGAFVGVDTMLVAPVKLGKESRTGAGSVVTKDVPDGATAVGVPARVVRRKILSSDSPSEAK